MTTTLFRSFAEDTLGVDDLFSDSVLCEELREQLEFDDPSAVGLDELAIGLMAFEFKQFLSAAAALQRVGEENLSEFALAQEWLGASYLRAGHPELAIEPLHRAVQLDQQLGRDPLTIAECQFSLGLAYLRTGHHECALVEFDNALACEPDWGTVLFEIARVHALRNRVGEAIAALAKSVQQDEFFLVRALHDFDFETVRQSAEFDRLVALAQSRSL